jgi:hypothetical protein
MTHVFSDQVEERAWEFAIAFARTHSAAGARVARAAVLSLKGSTHLFEQISCGSDLKTRGSRRPALSTTWHHCPFTPLTRSLPEAFWVRMGPGAGEKQGTPFNYKPQKSGCDLLSTISRTSGAHEACSRNVASQRAAQGIVLARIIPREGTNAMKTKHSPRQDKGLIGRSLNCC